MDGSGYLITGANGQLGRALQARYPKARATDAGELDITDWQAVKKYDWSGVKLILNAAAYTNVDGAETDDGRRAAWQVNAQGPANLVRISQSRDFILVHISTDYVFDGRQKIHKEDEPLSPLGVYGASKAAGDLAIKAWPQSYLLRSSWVIGDGKNFVRTMLELGQKGVNPTVVADQIGRPTFTAELVRAVDHLLNNWRTFGTYNVSNGGEPVSWAGLTREIFKQAGFDNTVSNTTTAEYYQNKPAASPRPLNSTFDLAKIEATGFKPTDWRQDLRKYIKKELRMENAQ